MQALINFQEILLVSIGAVFGVSARFIIYQKLKKINVNEYLITLYINTFSCFFLGLFLSLLPKIKFINFSYQLVLFVVIGLLGSFSTFSTFVYDLFNLFREFKFALALKLLAFSFTLGIIALILGSLLGN